MAHAFYAEGKKTGAINDSAYTNRECEVNQGIHGMETERMVTLDQAAVRLAKSLLVF
jgi:hypothetical protein